MAKLPQDVVEYLMRKVRLKDDPLAIMKECNLSCADVLVSHREEAKTA